MRVVSRIITHGGLVQCIHNIPIDQLKVSTSMIKTNHLNWYVKVLLDEKSNFTIDYEHSFMSLQGFFI